MPENDDSYKKYADGYDQSSDESGWHVPELFFGLMYLHIHPGQKLLDLGIGTGLGSERFHRAGLKIYGMDNSPAMLDVCRRKNMAAGLIRHDLSVFPWPYENEDFDQVIIAGVTHFLGELQDVFSEVARIIKPGGLFGFDFHEYDAKNSKGYEKISDGVYEYYDAKYEESFYRHTVDYIFRLLEETGFILVSDAEISVSKQDKRYFKVFIVQRQSV
ncbi:MAG: methyltransferase domain-containing protein [FCB group bacterium]|nr:methyltransferase domain-containing protein [FCB group bacterium]